MKSKIILLITGLVLIVTSGCGVFSKKYLKTETIQRQINTDGKRIIKLDNISGSITISHSKDSNLLMVKAVKEIKVKKKYLDTPFNEIEVKFDTLSNVIIITTEIDKDGQDEIFKFNINRRQRVDYEIQVPSNMHIEVENVNGNVASSNLDNDLKIDLVNGDVALEKYTGRLGCDITNGSFTGHVDSTRGIDINIINGSATLNLNNYMNANLKAETENGKITNENLQLRDIIKEKGFFKAKLGTGDSNVDIKIETVNGKIRLYGRNEI